MLTELMILNLIYIKDKKFNGNIKKQIFLNPILYLKQKDMLIYMNFKLKKSILKIK
jgi:hypothetical protein